MLQFSKLKIFSVTLVCLLSIIFALPNFVSEQFYENTNMSKILPQKKLKLGLDLQGGSQLLLKVQFKEYYKEQLENLLNEIRQEFLKNKIGYKSLKSDKSSVTFALRDLSQTKEAEKTIKKIGRELDLSKKNGVFSVSYGFEQIEKMQDSLLSQSIEIVRRRVDETGTTEPIIQRQGEDKIILQVPGLENPEELKKILGKTAKLSFHIVTNVSDHKLKTNPGRDKIALPSDSNENVTYILNKKTLLTGELLTNAQTTFDQNNRASVSISFNRIGGKRFGDITKQNVGQLLAIVLDKKVISAAKINEPIYGGNAIINGSFSVKEATDLAMLLRAGSLPAPLSIIEERTVGPSLGIESIEAGKKASIIGALAVLVFVFLTYGIYGIFANLALAFNITMIIALLSTLEASLTLPGIAGIVLTIGMAVDANVLIFERIKEELRSGYSPINSIERGYSQAFGTILDSNLTTIIAASLLFMFGSGSVKGFAITLIFGIVSSMFSAITLTRLTTYLWFKYNKKANINHLCPKI